MDRVDSCLQDFRGARPMDRLGSLGFRPIADNLSPACSRREPMLEAEMVRSCPAIRGSTGGPLVLESN